MRYFGRKIILDTLKGEITEEIPYDPLSNDEFLAKWQKELGFDPRERYNTRGHFQLIMPKYVGAELWDTETLKFSQPEEEFNKLRKRFGKFLPRELPPGSRISPYGVVTYPSAKGETHLRHIINPLKQALSVKDVEDYPFPDSMEEWRWEGIEKELKKFKDEDYVTIGGAPMLLEDANFLRGMERFMMDMAEENEVGRFIMDTLAKDRLEIAKRLARMGVDTIGFGDHLASENGSFLSRKMLEDWIVKYYRVITEEALKINPGLEFIWHTDGRNHDFIYDDLMAIGVRCFNPVQPECDDPHMSRKNTVKE